MLLARRPGKAYLLHSLGGTPLFNVSSDRAVVSTKQLTYVITVNVLSLVSRPKTAVQLVYASADNTAIEVGPVLLPVISPGTPTVALSSGALRLPVRLVDPGRELQR